MHSDNQLPITGSHTLLYDSTFEGLFTAVFEVFEYKFKDADIVAQHNYNQENIFSEIHKVVTDFEKSDRVLKKLEENLGKEGISRLIMVYFSERKDLERLILSTVRHSIKHPKQNILQDFANSDILEISKICKSVGRETHRMNAFIRFEKLQDEVFFAKIEPDFNVLPLILKHFKARYQDQKWMIFDLKRHYGIFYDLKEAQFFYPNAEELRNFRNSEKFHHEEEKNYQKLWQRYFVKTGIPERKNLKLHIQWMPKRYWKYLTEKF
jgi:probable DNA metabolism protein